MEEWKNFYQKLSKVNNFKIPRCILLPATIRIEIHGFSDVSERAYVAVVYIKCFNESGQSQTRLLCSKSSGSFENTHHTEGGGDPDTFKRLSLETCELQEQSCRLLISRFCNVDELLKNEMWFSSPDLQTDEYEDNQLFPDPSYRDELKCVVTLSITVSKIAQLSEFKAEIDALEKGKGVSKTSKLKALDPFLDENSLLRVGERLSNADLPFEAKHQIIIPTTKAIHLEAVTDLTTEAFIAALKRLCARRGRISTLMSDNAINFKGAAAELNHFIKLIYNKNETLVNYFASEAIQWKFIPPRSPNFGGLGEAGIIDYLGSSIQQSMYKVFGNAGKRIILIIYSRETSGSSKKNVAVGCLVLLKENDLPPCKWAMARILEVIYGTDGKAGRHAVLLARWIVRSVPLEIVGSSEHEKVPTRGKPDLERPGRPRGEMIEGSDESRLVLGTDDNRVRVWRRPGERYNSPHTVLRHTARTAGVMVWGAIAYDSRSTLIVMCGTLTGQRYVDNILRPHVGPFLNGTPGTILQQDKARPHTARVSQDFLRHFQTLPWPARFPDLSPVEHVWDQLKRQMPSCHSVHDLELAVQDL
ncbi:integrase catalytic domain-containing protein [Trichonephila clavipes]|nr:integrase catalytic domain-containing protein [Trichonephila clavipes]